MAGSFGGEEVLTNEDFVAAQNVYNRIMVAGYTEWARYNPYEAIECLAGLIAHSYRLSECLTKKGFGVTMPASIE